MLSADKSHQPSWKFNAAKICWESSAQSTFYFYFYYCMIVLPNRYFLHVPIFAYLELLNITYKIIVAYTLSTHMNAWEIKPLISGYWTWSDKSSQHRTDVLLSEILRQSHFALCFTYVSWGVFTYDEWKIDMYILYVCTWAHTIEFLICIYRYQIAHMNITVYIFVIWHPT